MSLHDALLADLEDLDDDEEEIVEENTEVAPKEEEDMDDDEDLDDIAEAGEEEQDDLYMSSVHAIAKLADSEKMQRVMTQIEEYGKKKDQSMTSLDVASSSPEYELVVEANNLTAEIDNEIGVVHKYIRDKYAKRFPELEQLVREPLDYVKTVQLLQNNLDVTQAGVDEILAPATVMIVSVSATTTQGVELSADELRQVNEGCEMLLRLDDYKARIYSYVESKMFFLAPNLTHICGSSTAARLLGVAGGLEKLSKMPACNILVLGAQKKSLSGFSAAATLPHTGFIYYSELVQSQPPDFRRKCARLVAAKVALAARVDSYRSTAAQGATIGIKLREDIEKKMEKAMEPPPGKTVKALPRPDDPYKKRRGGKRFRRQKERQATTEAMKAANRMTFGEIEEDVVQEEMAAFSGPRVAKGRLRAVEATQKGGALSKKMQRRLQREASHGGMSTIRGTATAGTASVSFTPMQGLEIVSKHLEQKKAESNKYFGNEGFVNVAKKAKKSS
ncbi:U4/U6 small nuclear ribonucleoprotein Prp31 [Salpingoeca rosetta]|uniref:U4/U6 small nuclear ribonucleoprotein Prp31 n=1 Tax=Salpingoeca rosetta (strain ATCC 50818 / BSB-021) TaxID=946362 RepID=F2UCP0_SALR5|nr:U4/U6 small nuclear ribonucleoprotein Prp31 [Salpingoeca rosetta]EGD74347.1 U4/U6 small nuclear ribonucleoprotein Prp31 [Salpingoeca rosetta]|eukprot:XP_004993247.1 U4/U6 small nuclear ribonucleoprotein Prp31 [Salpingoeca rosetta]